MDGFSEIPTKGNIPQKQRYRSDFCSQIDTALQSSCRGILQIRFKIYFKNSRAKKSNMKWKIKCQDFLYLYQIFIPEKKSLISIH